jgi:hypothetical protein
VYDFSTKAFEEQYVKAVNEGNELQKEAKRRRGIAYFLKGIAVAGGIALATGLPKLAAQIIGIVIAVVIATDELFANVKRLTVITTAAYAYQNLFDKIQFKYNYELQEKVIAVRDSFDGDKDENNRKAYQGLVKLNQEFSALIYENTIKLKEKVQKSDLAFLASVAQDKDKDKISTTDYESK